MKIIRIVLLIANGGCLLVAVTAVSQMDWSVAAILAFVIS